MCVCVDGVEQGRCQSAAGPMGHFPKPIAKAQAPSPGSLDQTRALRQVRERKLLSPLSALPPSCKRERIRLITDIIMQHFIFQRAL